MFYPALMMNFYRFYQPKTKACLIFYEKQATQITDPKLKKEALESVNFVEKIDEINLEFNKYVIFTDGKVQLIYEDGEFYVVSSTDATVKKEKKKKEEAKNMYLEYFIRYVLNPIIKQRDINEHLGFYCI